MNIALWIAQGILGLFIYAGLLKTFSPKEKLAPRMLWVNDFSAGMVKFIGVAEFLIGLGVILPWLTGIAPILTPIAALAQAVIMLAAAIYHFSKKEYQAIVMNIIFLSLSVFVAWGRFA